MAKNYYLVLGVPLDASREAIRAAYRRLAWRYHPDRGQESDSATFQEAAEAYGVLSDPGQRARYDRRLRRVVPAAPNPVVPREPEPLIAEPVSLTDQPERVHPSFDALMERLARNFLRFETPKAERLEPLHFELILSPEEARRGVRVPFQVPVFTRCHLCDGTGQDWLFTCHECGGDGRLVNEEIVHVDIPAHVRDQTRLDVSLDRLGVRNLWLRVHVRVAGVG